MDEPIKYRGRVFTAREVEQAREVIAANSEKSRRFISQELCRQWGWIQPNGILKDMVCRGLLKQLEDLGLVILPPRKRNPPNPFLKRIRPEAPLVDQSEAVSKKTNTVNEPPHTSVLPAPRSLAARPGMRPFIRAGTPVVCSP